MTIDEAREEIERVGRLVASTLLTFEDEEHDNEVLDRERQFIEHNIWFVEQGYLDPYELRGITDGYDAIEWQGKWLADLQRRIRESEPERDSGGVYWDPSDLD